MDFTDNIKFYNNTHIGYQPLGAVYEGAVRPAVTIPTAARVFYTEEFEFYPQLRPRLRSTFCGLDGTKKR